MLKIYSTKGRVKKNKKKKWTGGTLFVTPPPPPHWNVDLLIFLLYPLASSKLKDYKVMWSQWGGGAVLSTLVKKSWCGQSLKGPRGQTSLGVCWVNSQTKVEQVSSCFDSGIWFVSTYSYRGAKFVLYNKLELWGPLEEEEEPPCSSSCSYVVIMRVIICQFPNFVLTLEQQQKEERNRNRLQYKVWINYAI